MELQKRKDKSKEWTGSSMIRVLQVVNNMHRAGLETMLMNYYRHMDRDKIQFDFLTHRPERDDYDDEIESLGGKVYYAPRLYPQNYPAYFKYMSNFFHEHSEYEIMHSHIDAMSYLPLKAAKKAGVPIRIAHSHNTSIDRDFKLPLKLYYRSKIMSVANYYCACGKEAGEFLFPNKEFTFIPNAIEPDKFLFNKEVRNKKRSELGVNDQLVVGHVGRLSYQKNHKFLIDIFNELLKMNQKAVLLLVGVGEKKEEIKKQIEELGIQNKVMFLGNRSDVNELYQAMDVFVLPSLFEGIPVVGIEAQFAGLPCVFSDKVPREVDFSGDCKFVGLNKDVSEWTCAIIENIENKNRNVDLAQDSIYNIENSYTVLEKLYLGLNKKIKDE